MSDWKLYLKIRDECCEAERNHNIRQDLLEKDIVRRFAKAIREQEAEKKGNHGHRGSDGREVHRRGDPDA
jgi:hypothetical protein